MTIIVIIIIIIIVIIAVEMIITDYIRALTVVVVLL